MLHNSTPQMALLDLHRLVDSRMRTLLGPLGLTASSEAVVLVSSDDISALGEYGDPLAALARMPALEGSPQALLVIEPSLDAHVLSTVFRHGRSDELQLTNVEQAIVQQFASDACARWKQAFETEKLPLTPDVALVGTLSLVAPQLESHTMFAVRCVVRRDEPGAPALGALIFLYPHEVAQALVDARNSLRWRSRIQRGLDDRDREQLDARLAALRDVRMPVPATVMTDVPLRAINALERGDVIELGDAEAGLPVRLLASTRSARLVQCGEHLALQVLDNPSTADAQYSSDNDAAGDLGLSSFDSDDMFNDEGLFT